MDRREMAVANFKTLYGGPGISLVQMEEVLQNDISWRERYLEEGLEELDEDSELLELAQRRGFLDGERKALELLQQLAESTATHMGEATLEGGPGE
jgi:hypothetical protein